MTCGVPRAPCQRDLSIRFAAFTTSNVHPLCLFGKPARPEATRQAHSVEHPRAPAKLDAGYGTAIMLP